MSFSINQVTLTGYAANDAEFINKNDHQIANFTIAVDSSYKKDGKWVNGVEYLRIRVFGKLAEHVSKSVTKGARIELTGMLRNKLFTTKDGQTASDMHVEINRKGSISIFPKKDDSKEETA